MKNFFPGKGTATFAVGHPPVDALGAAAADGPDSETKDDKFEIGEKVKGRIDDEFEKRDTRSGFLTDFSARLDLSVVIFF